MHHPSPPPTDHDLLTRYLAANDQSAFTDLAARHIDSLYAAAKRQVRDPHLAEEVIQTVLLILVRRTTLRNTGSLAGWLHKVLWFTTRAANRTRARRLRHEQKAHAMSSHPPQPADAPALLNELTPLLDNALAKLTDAERSAILLRFMQDRPLAEVAHLLNITEAAATRRISRALANLRRLLARHGLSASSLSATLIAAKSPPAPAHLLPSATHAALTAATAPLLSQTLRALALAKLKLTLALTAACSLLILLTAILTFHIATPSHAAAPIPATRPEERLIHLGQILEPSSDHLIAQILAGLEQKRPKLKTLQIESTTTFSQQIGDDPTFYDSEITGKGWFQTGNPSRFRLEITLERGTWPDGPKPYTDDSFTETWDGSTIRILHQPPHSILRAEVSDQEGYADGTAVFGRNYSMQLAQNIGFGAGGREFKDDPLDIAFLKTMRLSASRVLMNGRESLQLEARFHPMPTLPAELHAEVERYFRRYWFDPARGFALLASQWGLDNAPPAEELIIDELAQPAPGIFYPTRARLIGYAHDPATDSWHLTIRSEFHATHITANQPLPPSLFHLDFPPGIPISHRGPSASSQPATQP